MTTAELRRRVYRHFADTGRPPELASAELAELAKSRAVVLDDAGRIEFANPFAAGPTDFLVTTSAQREEAVRHESVTTSQRCLTPGHGSAGLRYYGTCVWDAFGILALLRVDGRVATRCGDCGDALALEVRGGELVESDAVVHFLVPAARWYEDLRHT